MYFCSLFQNPAMKEFLRLMSLIKKYKGYAALNVLFNILTILFSVFSLGMIIPFLKMIFGLQELSKEPVAMSMDKDGLLNYVYYQMSLVIDKYGQEELLIGIAILTVVTFFFKNFFRYLAMWSIAPLRNGIIRDLRNMIYQKITILPLSFFSEQKKGDIISRATSDVQDIEWSILGTLELLFNHIITIVVFLIILWVTSYQLTLLMFVLMPLTGLVVSYLSKVLKRESRVAQKLMGIILSSFEEGLSGLRIIKGFNAEKFMYHKFEDYNNQHYRMANSVRRRADLSSPISEFFSMIVVAVIIWYGGRMVASESIGLTGETFIFFILLFSQMIPSIKAISNSYYRIQKGLASAERVFVLMDEDEVIHEKKNALEVTDFTDSINYDNIRFKYKNEWVLKDVKLNIRKGEMIALVGSSGAGKSTMADLLPRFYDVSEGKILIDGKDIRDLKLGDLRRLMGIVTQESILFNDSVKNNIRFGNTSYSDEEIVEAAKAANAHEFIKDLPEGYDTFIGDRGSKLSGGQRQRLTIARALLLNPPILILDEATSALDTESEKLVQDALQKLMVNRTSVVIAHRLSTIQNANRIIVLDKGEIVEEGAHHELITQKGIYYRLSQMQNTDLS
jgi:subfamily B ATP-binding cassette protein MsbA